MTTGNPYKKNSTILDTILIGNLFQQLCSFSDTLIVERFLGKKVLAAVGASSALIILIQSIVLGLSMGSSVLFANLYASKETEALSKSTSTTLSLSWFFLYCYLWG